ncbi:hypothetical protein N0B31_02730 [Salinirubellus salinus]|uniref:Uncharacterized protein n=1 Tax=Salinirubellus salinus TaxID=1364945 RepID=A0A9E7R3N4_9EURY|nr:hypothetical protein [Salinirubellus salinus]UWM55206.1 hypothetical protein N0B31_02730 [Salinirubellus salinus]
MSLGLDRLQELRQIAQNPRQSEHLREAAGVIAHIEAEQRRTARELHDVLDVPGEAPALIDEDARVDQLCDLLSARVSGNLQSYWLEHHVPDHVSEADDAETVRYVGMDAAEWNATCREWAENYREQGVDGGTTEIADAHIRRTWDVPLEEFEELVVNVTPQRVLQEGATGPSQRTQEAYERAVDHAAGESE